MCEVLSSDSPTDRTVFVHDASSGGGRSISLHHWLQDSFFSHLFIDFEEGYKNTEEQTTNTEEENNPKQIVVTQKMRS